MSITVILATYKRNEILSRTLESFCCLNTSGLNWEVIVVDNANDSSTEQLISGYTDKMPIKYIVETKRGKNNALNKAIEIAKSELFVFTDDDVLADCNWLLEMWEGSKRWPSFSIFGGRILPNLPQGKIPLSKEHPFFNSAYVIADWDLAEGQYDSRYVWGPNMAIRSKIFHDGWRFNPDIGPCGCNYMMGSETEFTMRLHKAGMGAVYLPECLVYHQIRLEQLETNWLYERAFRFGRSHAQVYAKQNNAYLFNAPRWLIRKFVEIAIKRIVYCFDDDKKIETGIEYWIIKGNIYQHRLYSNTNNHDYEN